MTDGLIFGAVIYLLVGIILAVMLYNNTKGFLDFAWWQLVVIAAFWPFVFVFR